MRRECGAIRSFGLIAWGKKAHSHEKNNKIEQYKDPTDV